MAQDRGKLDDTLAAMFSNITYSQDYLFYAHMIGQCSIKIEHDLPAPAGVGFSVDHYNLYVNPSKFDEYTLIERLAILKHEMLHILYGHVARREERHPMTWNYATDCALNQQIEPTHLPVKCVLPSTLGAELKVNVPLNKSSEFYYELIKEQQKQQKHESQGDSGGDGSDAQQNSSGGYGELMDSHDTWNESTGDPDLQKDLTKKMIDKAQVETIKSKGKVPQQTSEWLEMFSRKSEVDWKKVLRGITGNKRVHKRSTIMRTDRRFPDRSDLRGKTRDRMFNLLVVADVSGSMSSEAVLSTLGEVQHICAMTRSDVDLIQVDTVAFAPEKLSKKTKLIERKASGGTSLHPALEMAKKHKLDFNAVVVLTDGGLWDGDVQHFDNCGVKVIWLIESNGVILPSMRTKRMQAFKLKA